MIRGMSNRLRKDGINRTFCNVILVTRPLGAPLEGSSFKSYSGSLGVALGPCPNYLVVDTIAKRREPFANCNEIRVSLELIGENFTILPVTPVLLVVNKSPI
jgi:hypothetical protein